MTVKNSQPAQEAAKHENGGFPVAGFVLLFALFLTIVVSFILYWLLSRIRALADKRHRFSPLHELWEERYLPQRKDPSPATFTKYAYSPCELQQEFLLASSTENLLLRHPTNCPGEKKPFWSVLFGSDYRNLTDADSADAAGHSDHVMVDREYGSTDAVPLVTLSHQVAGLSDDVVAPAGSPQLGRSEKRLCRVS
ncbi:hypothetical protein BV898_03493 [Hypsibius exemplaris]|uniref:Uncharacterized protein n=1 Tax=Hypsibius exemplaris TaxID=2072580 RepID=A0A1W0X5I7_HYPEX|nr:hypothetical protein BV898_03493 [Hypsibius exemplaris]